MTARKHKPLKDSPIDEVIRLLAQAAGIAKRKRMAAVLRYRIGYTMIAAFNYAERLRARKGAK